VSAEEKASAVLVVRRTIPFSREEVFEAWLDPEILADFMRPNAFGRASVEVDPRGGGRYRIVMHGAGGRNYEHHGEYLAITPPSSLSFTWISEFTPDQPTVVTIDFLEAGGGTEVVLTHRLLPASQIESHRDGWTQILELLERSLG
jgi:uncharacterized protein YndB with AHSA1/START domain